MDADFDKLADIMGDRVVGRDGDQIGKVTQVAYEPNTLRAEWLVVKTSLFGRERLVPLKTAVAHDGVIEVPFSKEAVLGAPVPDIPTTPAITEASALESYYARAA